MSYNYYLNQPMQTIERRLNMNIAKNPQLINSLKRGGDHSLIRKYIDIPVKIQLHRSFQIILPN